MPEQFPPAVLPRANSGSRPRGIIRREDADFQVSEVLSFEPSGDGEHRYFQVCKTGHNSQWAARMLALATGVRERDVGFAGRKDRHGVTTQWFSVCMPSDTPITGLPAGIEILAETRHRKKLQRGALRGNRFEILVRDVCGDNGLLGEMLASVAQRGFPNYFGEQRFGRGGANLERARAWFCAGRKPRSRGDRSFALSAARSQLFNLLLSWRVEAGDWCVLRVGDVAQLAGTRSIFAIDEMDETLHERVASGDLDPTGPLWGRGDLATQGEILALERRLNQVEPELADGLSAAGMKQERRALRTIPRALEGALSEGLLRLCFELPRGSFATALLREIIDYDDVATADANRATKTDERKKKDD